jgi:hypothetical protein
MRTSNDTFKTYIYIEIDSFEFEEIGSLATNNKFQLFNEYGFNYSSKYLSTNNQCCCC